MVRRHLMVSVACVLLALTSALGVLADQTGLPGLEPADVLSTTDSGAELQYAPPSLLLPAPDEIPLVAEHHYRMSGGARALLLLWITRDNVGGGRMTWRRAADGTVSLELLTGSDPTLAPFGANRWGYIREVTRGDEAELIGVKSETDEETIEDAKRNAKASSKDRLLLFIREHVNASRAVSWTRTADIGRDGVSYRDLDAVLQFMSGLQLPQERVLETLPPDVRPGFLAAFTELMQASVVAHTAQPSESTRGRTDEMRLFIHRAKVYELRQRRVSVEQNVAIAGKSFGRALEGRFEIRNPATGDANRFDVTYGIDGDVAAVPLRIRYRPRWWLRTELTLDEASAH